MKKVGKTTRPFRHDLNQITYDYTVEVRNRFKRLDPIDRVPDEVWMEVQEAYTSLLASFIRGQTEEAKSKGEKGRYKHLNAEFQRTARRDKKEIRKPSSEINAKK